MVTRFALFYLNFGLASWVFLIIYTGNDLLSFDYRYYINFIDEIQKISLSELLMRAKSNFPYIAWGDGFGRFEVGRVFITCLWAFTAI